MANSYFQFKKFRVDQGDCAMKVTTEGCLLGAWIPQSQPNRILDIGAGTGLLSLMLAQRFDCSIDALEIDPAAAKQATANIKDSAWSDQIEVIEADLFDFASQEESHQKYDLIISNPPFFANALKSTKSTESQAKHDGEIFDKRRFAGALKTLLSNNGSAFILYPEYEQQLFQQEVERIGLPIEKVLTIYNQPNASVFRVISQVNFSGEFLAPEVLNIRKGNNHTPEFEALLGPYYLKL